MFGKLVTISGFGHCFPEVTDYLGKLLTTLGKSVTRFDFEASSSGQDIVL